MLGKKLLTIACVLGILAFGACFGPVYHPPPRPLAPGLDLSGVHSIGVTVTNNSESHHVDTSTLEKVLEEQINDQSRDIKVKARVQKGTGSGDAVLAVVILSENATEDSRPNAIGYHNWTFVMKMSVTLTARDGRVIWNGTNEDYSFSQGFPAGSPVVWNGPRAQSSGDYFICLSLVNHVFFGKPLPNPPAATPLQ
jgi:hypothetical protein